MDISIQTAHPGYWAGTGLNGPIIVKAQLQYGGKILHRVLHVNPLPPAGPNRIFDERTEYMDRSLICGFLRELLDDLERGSKGELEAKNKELQMKLNVADAKLRKIHEQSEPPKQN